MATPATCIRGRYELAALLSETLYGGVFLARDLESPRRKLVVLKLVELRESSALAQEAATTGPQQLDDPRLELAAAAFLRARAPHPNIVQYMDEFVEDGALYFVLEHCSDGDLYAYANSQADKRVPCVDALSILSQLANAVAFLHERNVAHRDLSLENTLLSGGTCKLSDFGLATAADRPCVERVGKAYYMAPEVVALGVAYDPKAADVWSLGIILFVLVTGSPLVAFASEDNTAFLSLRKFGVRRVLDSWGASPRLFPSAIDLIEGMLEVDPAKRLTIAQVRAHAAFADWQRVVEQQLAQP